MRRLGRGSPFGDATSAWVAKRPRPPRRRPGKNGPLPRGGVRKRGGSRVKPPLFEYHAATSVEEAVSLLAEHGDEAKVLAGGQSLMPLLSLRLARPAHLVDVNGIAELAGVTNGTGLELG